MVKYNYYYCEEFKEVILTKKNNEKVILNKIELKKYLKSNCLMSVFQKLLHSLQGKDFSEDEIRRSIDTLLNNNKIYFIRMPNYVSSFTIYDGTIFINRNFFDEASCPYKKEEKEEDKDKNKKGIRGRGKNDKKDGKGKDKKGKDKKGYTDEKKDDKKDGEKDDENKDEENKEGEIHMDKNVILLNQLLNSILGISLKCFCIFVVSFIIGLVYEYRLLLINFSFWPVLVICHIIRRQLIGTSNKKSAMAKIETGGILS